MRKTRKWIKGATLQPQRMENTFLASMINPSCLSVCFLLSVKKRISGFLFSWKLLYCLANSHFFSTLDLTLQEALS
jgi:hypothetical protein